ncbi:transmembrane protein 87A-like, partial [Psammomys obesus]|uniref:transmembrane protein 87A-like n=1 Tax=Psammomys obesus TaxID=48139 RepID=UPI00245360B1
MSTVCQYSLYSLETGSLTKPGVRLKVSRVDRVRQIRSSRTGVSDNRELPFDGEPCDLSLNITWFLKSADCYNEIYNFKTDEAETYLDMLKGKKGLSGRYQTSSKLFQNCSELYKAQSFSGDLMRRLPLLGEKQEAKENGTNLTYTGDKIAMHEPLQTWQDAPYIFIVHVGLSSSKESPQENALSNLFT